MLIIALTPIVGISFPALTPIVFAAAAAMGYKALSEMRDLGPIGAELENQIKNSVTAQVPVYDTVLAALSDEVKRAETLFFRRDQFTLIVTKDERGKFLVKAVGPIGTLRSELEQAGRSFAEEIAQLYARNRAVQEVERLGAEITSEANNEVGDIVLKVTRWH